MTTENLKQTLINLHAALTSGTPLDPEMVALLKTLDSDIQSALARQAQNASAVASAENLGSEASPSGLTIRAQEISAKFAVQHPHLEPVLRELSDTLQRIGI